MKKKVSRRGRYTISKKASDIVLGERRTSFALTENNVNMMRIARLSTTEGVNQALDMYFTFSLTLYIIINKVTRKYHIGFFENHDPHDLYWHYIHSTGSGTVGDDLRKEGLGRFKFKIIAKFSDLELLARTFKLFRRSLKRRGEPYLSYRDDDNVELLLSNYSKGIGKYNGKKISKNI